MTPEEIGDIATKHNGGKFLALTDLVNERIEKNIHRDFSNLEYMEEIHEQKEAAEKLAKVLPFKKGETPAGEAGANTEGEVSLSSLAHGSLEGGAAVALEPHEEKAAHAEGENMSSFILIEKERLKRSQKILKQKEIIDLYQKNVNVDVEQIRSSNSNFTQSNEAGVLVNKKQF